MSKPRPFALRFYIDCASLLRSFAYARIIPESEHHGDRKLLKNFHIEPVYEAHDIFRHLIRAIIETLSSERGPPVRAFVLPSQSTLSNHTSVLQPVDHHISSSPILDPQAGQERTVTDGLQRFCVARDVSLRRLRFRFGG